MKLLFENWRNYLTEAKEKYIDPGQDQDVAEYEDLFLQYREEFIETVILSRKKELDKLIEDLLGPKRSKLVPTPWLLEQIVKVIRNTKIVFMAGSAPTEDPDYGGPAFFHSGKNLITVEQFHKYWLLTPGTQIMADRRSSIRGRILLRLSNFTSTGFGTAPQGIRG